MIEVANLFYNTPARRKFLRSAKTEFQLIDEVVRRLALSYPHTSFRLKHDGRMVRYIPAMSTMLGEKSRLAKICGERFVSEALPINMQAVGLQLQGWLGHPSLNRRQGDCQYFFVNQRMIKDRLLNHVIKTLYQNHPAVLEGTYPCYVLHLTIDPFEVDVNVHPTKQEVRFAQTRLVHDFLSKCVAESLQSQPVKAPVATFSLVSHRSSISKGEPRDPQVTQTQRYMMIEEESGIVVVNKTTAQSQILASYFKNHWGHIATRALLFPQSFPLAGRAADKIVQTLSPFGFSLRFAENKVLFLQQPGVFKAELTATVLEQLLPLAEQNAVQEIQSLLSQYTGDIFLQEQAMSTLLQELIKGEGPWRRFNHEDL
jgi:DNA mismatch repair ATPase MutL